MELDLHRRQGFVCGSSCRYPFCVGLPAFLICTKACFVTHVCVCLSGPTALCWLKGGNLSPATFHSHTAVA